jgi:hypothetical protein
MGILTKWEIELRMGMFSNMWCPTGVATVAVIGAAALVLGGGVTN